MCHPDRIIHQRQIFATLIDHDDSQFFTPKGRGFGGRPSPTPRAGLEEERVPTRPITCTCIPYTCLDVLRDAYFIVCPVQCQPSPLTAITARPIRSDLSLQLIFTSMAVHSRGPQLRTPTIFERPFNIA